MPSFVVLAIILPLVGAVGVLGLSLVPRLRPYTHYVALVAACLTAVSVLALRWVGPIKEIPLSWQPSLLLGVTPVLQGNITTQPLALALVLAVCSTILVELSRTEAPRPRRLATLLTLLAASFVPLWAATPLTVIIGWAGYDLLQAAERIAAGGTARTAVRGLIFGYLATLLLWGGTLLSGTEGGSALWSLMSPSAVQLSLWTVAGLLRLWVYPLHLSVPDDPGPVSSLTSLLSPVIGWGLFLQLILVNGGSLPGSPWVSSLAALTLAVGSFLAWSCKNPRSTLPWIGMGSTGAVLLAAGLAGERATSVIAAGGVAWVMGMTALSLSDGLRRESPWWSIPALIGALALLGVPLTLGFASEATLLGGIAKESLLGGAFFLGILFLVPSLVRWLLLPSPSPLPDRRWLFVARGVGMGLPALLVIAAGLYSPLLVGGLSSSLGGLFSLPGPVGWPLWVVSLAGGGVLAWQERNLRSRMELLFSAAYDLLRLEWLYGAVVGALDRGLSVFRAADEVVSGAGALLWSWVLFLLILLVWGRL